MQDKELYQTILGLTIPWQVSDVELDVNQGEIRVSVEHPRGVKFVCPECNCSLPCFDHVNAPSSEAYRLGPNTVFTYLPPRTTPLT